MENIKKNIQNVLIITIFIKLLSFLYRILCARHLNFEILKVLNLLSPILNMSLVCSSLSIPTVLTRHISESTENPKYSNKRIISAAIKLTILSSILMFLLSSGISILLALKVYKTNLIILPIILALPLIFFSNLSAIIKSYLEAHYKYTITTLSNLIEAIVKIINLFIIIYIFKDKSVLFISSLCAISLLLCEVFSFTYLVINLRKYTNLKMVKNNKDDYIEILKPSFYLTFFALILTLSSFLEPIIYFSMTKHINIDQTKTNYIYTSLHSFIIPFIQIASFLTYIFVKILFPKIVKEKDNHNISNIIKKTIYILLFIELLMLNLSKYHSQFLFKLLYKKTSGYKILSQISIFNFITFISPILTMTMQAKKCEKKLLKSAITSSLFSLIILTIFSLIYKTAKYSIIICIMTNSFLYLGQNLIYCIKKGYINISLLNLLVVTLNIIINFLIASLVSINNQLFEISIECALILIIYSFTYKYLINKLKVK